MEAYKVELLIIDFDGMGSDDIEETLENTKYPNHCFNGLSVMSVVGKDIGEWTDEHLLNQIDKCKGEYLRIFGNLQAENERLKEESEVLSWFISTVADIFSYNKYSKIPLASVQDWLCEVDAKEVLTRQDYIRIHAEMLDKGLVTLPTSNKAIEALKGK